MNADQNPTPRRAPPLHLIRSADQRRMAWKNGGGFTTEVAVRPPGASLDTFDWRVSTAQVSADGPFSLFAGIERTLVVLEGAGLNLTVGDAPPVQLTAHSPPFAFAADEPTHASLVDGPVVDLNVMARRDNWRHAIERIDLATPRAVTLQATEWMIYCSAGSVRVSADGNTSTLMPNDAVTGCSPQANVEPGEAGTLYLIRFYGGLRSSLCNCFTGGA